MRYKRSSRKSVKSIRRSFFRIASIITIFVAALAAVLILSSNAVRTSAAVNAGTKYYKSVIIQPGDTLWSIAERYMDDSEYYDAREYINEVRKINGLGSDYIKSGCHLIVPYIVH